MRQSGALVQWSLTKLPSNVPLYGHNAHVTRRQSPTPSLAEHTAAITLIHRQHVTDLICLQWASFYFVAYDTGLSPLCLYMIKSYFIGLSTNIGYLIEYIWPHILCISLHCQFSNSILSSSARSKPWTPSVYTREGNAWTRVPLKFTDSRSFCSLSVGECFYY